MDVKQMIAVAERCEPPPLPEGIASYEDAQDSAVKGAWEITTQVSADWALARVAECHAEAEDLKEQLAAAVARLHKRASELMERADRGARYFEFKLAVWAEKNRATLLKGKSKSVHLLHGSIGWRKKGGRLTVTAPASLAAWLATQPVESGLYRMKIEPEMSEIQAAFKRDGVLPPGTEYEIERDEFFTRPDVSETALVKP